jgi:hypothetical protein
MRQSGRFVVACTGLLLLACVCQTASAQSPLELSGELEVSVTSRRLPSDDKNEVHSQAIGSTHLSSYLFRPWIATVTADLDVAFEANPKGEYTEASSVAGNVVISGLPASRFPFQIFFSAGNNHFDGDYSGADYTRLRGGVSGRAAFSDRTSLDYFFSHDQVDRAKYGELTAQRADVSLRHGFNPGEMPLSITDIGLSLNYYNRF